MSTSVLPGARPDRLEEECAVFGVFAPGEDVARMTCFGLQALQHRGQESAGIAVGDGETIVAAKDLGLVTQVFDEATPGRARGLRGRGPRALLHERRRGVVGGGPAAHLGHRRRADRACAQRHAREHERLARPARRTRACSSAPAPTARWPRRPSARSRRTTHHLREGIRHAMEDHRRAPTPWCWPAPIRSTRSATPTASARCASASCPTAAAGRCPARRAGSTSWARTYVRDVKPGEIVRFNARRHARRAGRRPPARRAACIFEYVYFARPDSVIDGQSVYQARRNMGRILAQEAPVEADLVLGVPDSGVPPALGFAHESGIPYADGIVKNRYVGRTFIEPTQAMRQLGIRLKLNPLPLGHRAASASSSSTTASCAATRRRSSCRCCATRARRRCTCAS